MHLSFFEARHAILKCQIELNKKKSHYHSESTCTFLFEKRAPPVLFNQIELNKRIVDFLFESTCTLLSAKHALSCFSGFPVFSEFAFAWFGILPDFPIRPSCASFVFARFVICWFLRFEQFSNFQHFEILWFSVRSTIRDFSDLGCT